jgi:hypothetical protein
MLGDALWCVGLCGLGGVEIGSGVVGIGDHNRGESFTVARQKGWLVESDTPYGVRGNLGRRYGGFGCVGLI